MRTAPCLLAVAIVAAAGGCNRDKPAPPPGSGAPATPAAPVAAAGSVEIFVNDAPVGMVQATQLASWPRLDTLVPDQARRLGTWERISLQGARPTPTDVARPSAAYPDMVPAIFPDAAGGAAFGMFDPVELARRGKPAVREDGVKVIRIKVADGGDRGHNDDGGGGGGGDPTKLVVTVKTPAGTTTLSGEQLLALPREPMPGNPDQKGWRLTAMLDAAGVTRYDRLVLGDTSGANLMLDRKDITATSIPFVKLNRQGALRLRVLKKAGEGWDVAGNLRGLISIEAK
jgi:hypothetical protein